MPDRKIAIIGAPNFKGAPFASSATFEVAGMTALNLATDEPSDRCRVSTLHPLETVYGETYGIGTLATRTLGGMGLINCNLSRFGRYRIVGLTSGVFSSTVFNTERLTPAAILASSNITGAVADVDEAPESPDANYIVPTSTASEWTARFSFATPATTPATGASKQAFVVWVQYGVAAALTIPLLKAELYEAGVLVSSLGTRVVSVAAGQLLIFAWDAALLSAASGADVEVRLSTIGNSSTGYVKLGALEWISEHSSFAFDSGWLASPFDGPSSFWGGTYAVDAGPEPMKNLAYLPASPWAGVASWAFMISDDQVDSLRTAALYAGDVSNPLSYSQAGVLVKGPAFIPTVVNFAHGPLVAVRDSSPVAHTVGGQETGGRRAARRIMPVTITQVVETEGYDLFDRLDWRKGRKLPVLVVKFPDADAATQRHTTLWATMEDMPGLGLPKALNRLSWSGLFVEKL